MATHGIYGASAVHRYLWDHAQNGVVTVDVAMDSLTFGCKRWRFEAWCKELTQARKLLFVGGRGRLKAFLVSEPAGMNDEDEPKEQLTADKMDDAIELFEQLGDELMDLLDDMEDE